jgi:hypothetical protein
MERLYERVDTLGQAPGSRQISIWNVVVSEMPLLRSKRSQTLLDHCKTIVEEIIVFDVGILQPILQL